MGGGRRVEVVDIKDEFVPADCTQHNTQDCAQHNPRRQRSYDPASYGPRAFPVSILESPVSFCCGCVPFPVLREVTENGRMLLDFFGMARIQLRFYARPQTPRWPEMDWLPPSIRS